jgi:hypothetical protein
MLLDRQQDQSPRYHPDAAPVIHFDAALPQLVLDCTGLLEAEQPGQGTRGVGYPVSS